MHISDGVDDEILWANGLSLTNIGPSMNPNYTKGESHNENDNTSNKIDNKLSWTDVLLFTNPNHTKSECCNNYCNISNVVSKEILFPEERQSNHSISTHIRRKYYGDNAIDNNRNLGN